MPQNKPTTAQLDSLNSYNNEFFSKRAKWRADYDKIARWIAKNVEGDSFGDLGCGNGLMISKLSDLGKTVWGVDAKVNAAKFVDKSVRKKVVTADLAKPQAMQSADVLLCFEIAERLDEVNLEAFMNNVTKTNATTVVFTFSPPGQAGIHHVNLQPREYWIEQFARCGYHLDAALSLRFKADLGGALKNLTWYPENVMILHNYDKARLAKAYEEAGSVIEELTAEIADLKMINSKMQEEYYHTAQHLNKILGSARWKAVSRALKLVRR